jgi:hypothetical protein
MAANPKDRPDSENERRGSYQNDPRYREYYERLRRENEKRKEETLRQYDEEVQPMTLDELSNQGWDGTIRRVDSSRGPSATPPPSSDLRGGTPPSRVDQRSATPLPSSANSSRRPASDPPYCGTIHMSPNPGPGSTSVADLKPGAILWFDDGSLAIFKDAVSGKDYALFYFLEPNLTLSPRGIFLEQYEYRCIGQMPLPLFETMKSTNRWNRDCIVFHLFEWDFVQLVPQAGAVVSSQVGRPTTEPGIARPGSSPARVGESEVQQGNPMPERGQALKINVAGRVWEAVYWAKDEMGHVVAHSTNRKWALMHLDLTRFADSMELGEIKPPEEIEEIQRHLVTTGS